MIISCACLGPWHPVLFVLLMSCIWYSSIRYNFNVWLWRSFGRASSIKANPKLLPYIKLSIEHQGRFQGTTNHTVLRGCAMWYGNDASLKGGLKVCTRPFPLILLSVQTDKHRGIHFQRNYTETDAHHVYLLNTPLCTKSTFRFFSLFIFICQQWSYSIN